MAVIRARVALAVTRDTTLALGGGTLDAADRAEILDAAVRALSPSAASAPSTVKAADPVDTASD